VLRVGALLLVAVASLAAAACGGSDRETAAAPGELVELSSAGPVAQAFDDAKGKPRLVLLLSPT
jgi:hypothetical protein